jgi:hypothetical protein
LAVKADDDILVNPERLVEIMEDKYPGMNINILGTGNSQVEGKKKIELKM